MRGELWMVAGGIYAGKPRPALVIQNDAYDTGSVTVLPLTTTPLDAPLLHFPIEPASNNGLLLESWVMIDKITTVRRSNLGQRLGRLSAAEVVQVNRLLAVFLGFG